MEVAACIFVYLFIVLITAAFVWSAAWFIESAIIIHKTKKDRWYADKREDDA